MSQTEGMESTEGNCFVALTHDRLDIIMVINRVRSPKAGAIVLFAGTTRDNFDGKPVKDLQYSSYQRRAMQTMMAICKEISRKHSLTSIAMIHRLGVVPIGEESVLIAVSSPHRQAAWKAGEEALEECKSKVEIWKLEEFGGNEGGVWRANRDGVSGSRVTLVKDGDNIPEGSSATKPRPYLEHGHGPPVLPQDGDTTPAGNSITKPGPYLEHGHGAPVVPQEVDPPSESCSVTKPRPYLEHGHGPPVLPQEGEPHHESGSATQPRSFLEHGHGPPVVPQEGDSASEGCSVTKPRPYLEHGHGPPVLPQEGDLLPESSSVTKPRPYLEHGHGPPVLPQDGDPVSPGSG